MRRLVDTFHGSMEPLRCRRIETTICVISVDMLVLDKVAV